MHAQRLVESVEEQIQHRNIAQVPLLKRLVFFPQRFGDLADAGTGQQAHAVVVSESRFDVAGRQSAGIHLSRQILEHLRIAFQQFEQFRVKRLLRIADLGQRATESRPSAVSSLPGL